MLQSGSESVVILANYSFAVKINERHCEARHAYMTIHLAVKTIHPLKERTAKVQLISKPRKGLEKKLAVLTKFISLQFNTKCRQPKNK